MIPEIDKLKHFYLWTLGFVVCAILLVQVLDNDLAMYISYSLTVLTAAGKEIVNDYLLKRGKAEWLDFWFSVLAPSLIMILYICLIK